MSKNLLVVFIVVVSSMRVDPKHLRGFHEVTLSFILVVCAGGLIGAASVSSLWKRPSPVHTVPVSGAENMENWLADEDEVSSNLPEAGTRVAVFLSLEGRSSILLFSDVRVLKGQGGEGNRLDVTGDQMEILQFAKRHGDLSYRVIPGDETSPYSGQDVGHIADLENMIGR